MRTKGTPVRQVAVCGPRKCTEQEAEWARAVGGLLAQAGATVLCGGGTGVMAAVAAGAAEAGGLVIGVRPDTDRSVACTGLSAVLFTNMGEARNAILVESADAVIAIGGSWGTLSEVALARRRGGIPGRLGGSRCERTSAGGDGDRGRPGRRGAPGARRDRRGAARSDLTPPVGTQHRRRLRIRSDRHRVPDIAAAAAAG
ncbi:SLOG cluster 4 domain-containing protein [Nocardia gipuzkoensis]